MCVCVRLYLCVYGKLVSRTCMSGRVFVYVCVYVCVSMCICGRSLYTSYKSERSLELKAHSLLSLSLSLSRARAATWLYDSASLS